MARLLVVYRTPKDPAAFDRYYYDTHVPLAKRLPGLTKYEVSDGTVVPLASAANPYLVATLHFDSLDAIKAAFASELGRACAADRLVFAPDDADVQMFLFDDRTI